MDTNERLKKAGLNAVFTIGEVLDVIERLQREVDDLRSYAELSRHHARAILGQECPDEGCPHHGTPHSHVPEWVKQYAAEQVAGAHMASAELAHRLLSYDDYYSPEDVRFRIMAQTPETAIRALVIAKNREWDEALKVAAREAESWYRNVGKGKVADYILAYRRAK